MDKNDKSFKGILILAGVLVVIGYILTVFVRLDDPVFFDHYYDVQIEENDDRNSFFLKLKYITNQDDNREILDVTFPEQPDLFIGFSETGDANMNYFDWSVSHTEPQREQYGLYSVRNLYIEAIGNMDIEDLHGTNLTEAVIHYNDSSRVTAQIGKIDLLKLNSQDEVIRFNSGTETYEGVSSSYTVHEAVTLSGLEFNGREVVEDRIDIDINGRPFGEMTGKTVEEGDPFFSQVTMQPSADVLKEYAMVSIYPELTVLTETGDEQTARLFRTGYETDHYSFIGLSRYVKLKEEGK